jgi:adenylate cyclase|tara:strand:- start:1801 stop:1995 length:195 start_codon:yes stop_codon:yes gene_type:complete
VDYSVIGDNVNLGARLCSAARAGKIILAGSGSDLLDKDNYALEELEAINVKGKKNKITMYRVEY